MDPKAIQQAVTAAEMRELEAQAVMAGTTWRALMERAGRGVTEIAIRMLQGTKAQKQIIMNVILSNASNTPGFTIGTYDVDTTSVIIKFNTQVNSNGQYVFLPHGKVSAGSGSIIITAVDSVKKQITGTFNFYSRSMASDGTITVDNILGGEFTSLPYNFTSN